MHIEGINDFVKVMRWVWMNGDGGRWVRVKRRLEVGTGVLQTPSTTGVEVLLGDRWSQERET